jgi:hypothetical protein
VTTLAASSSITGWVVGYVIAFVVVIAVVALIVPILLLARSIGRAAPQIDEALQESVDNTAALRELNTTIESADVIVAGLNRGRARLGG